MFNALWTDEEWRAAMSAADINDLPDSDFAYIEPGGEKDDEGKTTPRRLRHYPVHDEAHARNAYARASTAIAGDDEDAKAIAEKAMPKIRAAARKFGVTLAEDEQKSAKWAAEHRSGPSYEDLRDLLSTAVAEKFCPDPDDYAWVEDFSDEWVVYCQNGGSYQAPYAVDGTTVTLGEATPVRTQTTYVPVESKSAETAAETRDGGCSCCATCNAECDGMCCEACSIPTARSARYRTKKPRHRSGPAVGIEVRHFSAEGLEVRSPSDGSDTIEVVGSPIVYNAAYKVRGLFRDFEETMLPGVASAILGTVDCRFLENHEGRPHARSTAGTLIFADTPDKLTFTARMDARRQDSTDLALAIEHGDVTQMSCGFIVAPGGDDWNKAENERQVSRFADLLDVSAVTYPCSPTTDIAVAQRMMLSVPVESRAQVRRMWAFSRDLREGKPVDAETAQVLAAGLEALCAADENRAAPTAADAKVTSALKTAHQAMHDLVQAQTTDPDNGTDPADEEVWGHIRAAAASLTKASIAQSKDNAPEAEAADGGPDGTQNAPDPSPASAQDGTGSRSADPEEERRHLALELQLVATRRRRRGALTPQ